MNLRKGLIIYNAIALVLMGVMIRPSVLPLGLRADLTAISARPSVAYVLDVPWADPRLGTLRLDGQAVGTGDCRQWACESTLAKNPQGPHPALLLEVTRQGMFYPTSLCTGTLLADRRNVVTAAHCLAGKIKKVEVKVFGTKEVVAQSIHYRAHRTWKAGLRKNPGGGIDIAVVTLSSTLQGVPAFEVGAAVTGPMEVWGIQYLPQAEKFLVENLSPEIHRCRPSFEDVTVRNFYLLGPTVLVPCSLLPGASGGAVLTGDKGRNRLVGVVVSVDKNGFNHIHPIGDLQKDYGAPVIHTSK